MGEILCTKYETRSQTQPDQETDEKTPEQASNTNYISKNGKISEKQTPDRKSGSSERPLSSAETLNFRYTTRTINKYRLFVSLCGGK